MISLLCSRDSVFLILPVLLGICPITTNCIATENSNHGINENTTRPEVEIPQGIVRGVNMVTHHGRNISGFMGIPFAQPPVGNLRFKRPLPPRAWDGVLDASSDANRCPQVDKNVVIGKEDCLYLHVYTPRLPTTENSTLLPVMIYVFGGRFSAGHYNPTRWGPEFLLDKDVILVVPSYRLGILGFLSTGDDASPGNYGLKDMVRALEWNRDNIRYFGGDPNQVTLFGSSSGAMVIEMLTLSNSTNGLFHRYITQSGSALSAVIPYSRRVSVKLSTKVGEHFGCPTNTSAALVDCLMGLNAAQLVNAQSIFLRWQDFPQVIFGPTIEPDIEGAVLTDHPANLIAAGKAHDLPSIVSVVRDEGIVYSAMFYDKDRLFEELIRNIDDMLPHILQYNDLVDDVPAYTAALKSYFLNDLSADRIMLRKNFTQIAGDVVVNYSIYRTMQQRLTHVKSPIYFASFEYRGTFKYSYETSGGSTLDLGVGHSDELLYMLISRNLSRFGPPDKVRSEADLKMIDIMVQLWTSFAINGTPTSLDSNSTTIWEPYSSRKNYLRIGKDFDVSIGIEYDSLKDRMQFWDELTAATTLK